MRLAGIDYNGLPDNVTNGFQYVAALAALAGKNDLITQLSLTGGFATVPLTLSKLVTNEALVCKATFDYDDSVTQIKGSEAAIALTLTVPSDFNNGDYVRLIKTNVGVTLVRLADGATLDAWVGELLYLKAASDAEDIAGVLTTKASTPHSNKAAFESRVTGPDSDDYLATDSTNGLMSAEDKSALDGLASTRNRGWVSGIDVGGGTVGSSLPTGGDISGATITFVSGDGGSGQWECTMANAMDDTNYFVRMFVESQGSFLIDTNILVPVFKPISTVKFQFAMDQSSGGGVQSLKVHFEVVQLQ